MDAERPDGWDVADAVEAGWNWQKIAGWAKPRLKIIAMPTEPPAHEAEVMDAAPTDPVTVEHHVTLQEDHPNIRPSTFQTWEKLGVPLTKNGQPIISMDTALRVVERHPEIKDSVWFDDFHQTYFTTWKTGKQREWSEIDTLELTAYFQRDLRLVKMGDDNVFKAVLIHANNNTRNEPRDWIKTLRWDGVPRIGSFFPICFGSVDTEYTRAVSRNFWISMVARIMRPGCKVDTMVVLEVS
jgi:predicted P-loop ATPase